MELRKLCCFLAFGAFLVYLCALNVPTAFGQASTTGAILGTVTDSSGGVVPDAEVTIRDVATGVTRIAHTDSAGRYNVEALPASETTYSITVKKQGFKTFVNAGVVLNASARLAVNATLEVGSTASQVTVSASVQQVNTQSGESGGTIAGADIQNVENNGRDWRLLLRLVPGVVDWNTGVGSIGGGDNSNMDIINGVYDRQDVYTTDGVYNMFGGGAVTIDVMQPVDSVAEVTVLKDNYNAKYGMQSGANVNVSTKSGTKEFHGSAYDYTRNDALDARNFFVPVTPTLKQDIFGLSLGGPIYIPGHYNADNMKTFFFADAEARFRHAGSPTIGGITAQGALPTAAMRTSGDFTGDPTLPAAGITLDSASAAFLATQFPGVNCVPDAHHLNPACYDKNMVDMMNTFWPLPNALYNGFNNYINTYPDEYDPMDYTGRVDRYIGPNQKVLLTARVSYETGIDRGATASGPNPAPTQREERNGSSWNDMLRLSVNFNPTTISQTTISNATQAIHYLLYGDYTSNLATPLTIPLPLGNIDPYHRAPNMNLSQGWAGMGNGGLWPLASSNNFTMFNEDFTKVKGHHTLQAGFLYAPDINRQSAFTSPQGTFNFSGVHSGDSMTDFLLGLDSSFSQASAFRRLYDHSGNIESYFQDDWKVNRKLALNLGLREFYFIPDHSDGNGIGSFDPKTWSAAQAPVVLPNGSLQLNGAGQPVTSSGTVANMINGLVFPAAYQQNPTYPRVPGGTPGVSDSIYAANVHWAPRFGFAYSPTGSSKTSIRGGFGVGYGLQPYQNISQSVGTYPWITNYSFLNTTAANPSGGAVPSIAYSVSSESTLGYPGQVLNPQVMYSYSLTFEREIVPDAILSIAYVGNDAKDVPVRNTNLNENLPVSAPSINNPGCLQPGQTIPSSGFQFDPCINAGLVSANYTRPYPGYSTISAGSYTAAELTGRSYYNSLQMGFQYRAHHGLTLTVAYTYGPSRTDAQSYGFVAQDFRNVKAEWGPPNQDHTNIFTTSYVYDLPFWKNRNDLAGTLLGRWTFSGMTSAMDGTTFSPGLSIANTGLATRPNCTGSIPGPKTPTQWFNTSAFSAPAWGFYGTCGPDPIRGPGLQDWEWSLFKTFRIHENVKMQFRAAAFNIWNHPNFSSINSSYGSGAFGQVNGALDPRQIELGLRLDY
jgi:hypothetical protein